MIIWTRNQGYECSSVGDKRFSAFAAKMPDGRSIEQWYQCDVKGYDVGGTNWRLGKGKPPKFAFSPDELWNLYLSLWRLWALRNVSLLLELKKLAEQNSNMLCDRFASTNVNQARALATILNEWCSED